MTEREEGERERRDRRSRGVPCHHCLAAPCRLLKGRGSDHCNDGPPGSLQDSHHGIPPSPASSTSPRVC